MIFPAIDLKQGQSVRLYQGDFDQTTLIEESPIHQAQKYQKAGIQVLHLVDLDGAKQGKPINLETIEQIRQAFTGMIELGGGIRNLATIKTYLDLGIDRVILGSIAATKPTLVKEALAKYGSEKIVIGVDGKDGRVATEGWLNQGQVTMEDLIGEMIKAGAYHFIVTDVTKDGTLSGPNYELLVSLQRKYPMTNIIASGGIRNLEDIRNLQTLGIANVVVGKSLFAGSLTLEDVREVNSHVG